VPEGRPAVRRRDDHVGRRGRDECRHAGVRDVRDAGDDHRVGHAGARHPARGDRGTDALPGARAPRSARPARRRRRRRHPDRAAPAAARGRRAAREAARADRDARRPAELPGSARLRRRVVGRLPARGAPAAAAVDQAEHARDQRRGREASGAREVPAAAGPAVGAGSRRGRRL